MMSNSLRLGPYFWSRRLGANDVRPRARIQFRGCAYVPTWLQAVTELAGKAEEVGSVPPQYSWPPHLLLSLLNNAYIVCYLLPPTFSLDLSWPTPTSSANAEPCLPSDAHVHTRGALNAYEQCTSQKPWERLFQQYSWTGLHTIYQPARVITFIR